MTWKQKSAPTLQLQVQSKVPEVVLNEVGHEALSDEVKVVINANNAEIKE